MIRQDLQSERFPVSGLADLEQELSHFPFKGQSFAAAITSFLNPYRVFRGNQSLPRLFVDGGTLALRLGLGPIITILNQGARRQLNRSAAQLTGKVLYVCMSEKTHYQKMLTTLRPEFLEEEIVGLGLQDSSRQAVFPKGKYFQKKKVGNICRFADQVELLKVAKDWFVVLTKFRRQYGLSWYFVLRSLTYLHSAALRTLAYQEFLTYLSPRCVVCDFDRYLGNLSVVAAANNLGILTITLQHGTVNRTGWETLPSQYFLSWGENSKSRLVDWHGIDEDRVLVCGNLLIGDQGSTETTEQQSPRTSTSETLTVGFAPQPYSMDIRKTWFSRFIEAVTPLSVRVLIKPHPAEDIDLYDSYAKSFDNIELLKRSMPVFEFFDRCDVVVAIGSSSVALEAVSAKKPVVLLVVADSASSAASEWAAADAVLLARTSDELAAVLRKLQSDPAFYAARASAGQEYLRKEYAFVGKEAARRTRYAIDRLVEANAK